MQGPVRNCIEPIPLLAMSLHKLLTILTPPANPFEVPRQENWSTVKRQLGDLPEDYRAFLERFGTGVVNSFIWVLNPASANRYLNLLAQVEPILGALKTLSLSGEPCPYALHPARCGLLPFGKTDNGDALFWLTKGQPDRWTVVVNAARDPTYEEFACSATDFLAGVLSRRLRSVIFPESFPRGPTIFTPAAPS